MKWFSIILIVATMTGCLTGRSWDTPGKEIFHSNLSDLSGLTLYINGDVDLIGRAIKEVDQDAAGLIRFVESNKDLQVSYPQITVIIQPPDWRDNWFTNTSVILSGVTVSLIPGYMYQSSELIFRLTLPNKDGALITTDYVYVAKRHYVSWLPLLIVGNFTQTVQVWTEPKLDWDKGYKQVVRQFFQDAKPAFLEYRGWLGSRVNVSPNLSGLNPK